MKKSILLICIVLLLALTMVMLFACDKGTKVMHQDDEVTTTDTGKDSGKTPSGGGSNPNPSGGGDQQPSGGSTPSGGDSGGGDTTPTQPQVVYTTVQKGQAFQNGSTINLPTNTKAIGISSDLSNGDASSSAEGDDILNQYLVAFDAYNKVLTGNDGRITFTVRHKFYYEHEMRIVDSVDDDGNPIQIKIYALDDSNNYIYKEDEHGDKIPLVDENGKVVFAEDCTDEKEILGEDDFELLQEDFGMDVIKVKVVRNFLFVCFIVKLPANFDYNNNNATYNMLLEDGTTHTFKRSDLPKIRSDFNDDFDYDAHYYTSNKFTQSYVINLETSKIYPLTGVNIDTIYDDGYILRSDDNKAYDVRCLADDSNLSLIDISGIINDPHTISVFKDKAGILYVMSDNVSTMTVSLKQSGTLPYVSYPNYIRNDQYYIPYILQDKKGNVYTFVNHKLKKVIGFDFNNAVLSYSEENYGENSNLILFDDDFVKGMQYGYLISGKFDDPLLYFDDMSVLNPGVNKIGDSNMGFRPGLNLNSHKHFAFYLDVSFLPAMLILDKTTFGLYIAIPDLYLDKVSVATTLGMPDGCQMSISFYEISLVYNNSPLDLTGIQDISYTYHDEEKYLEIKLFMGKDDSFNDIYYLTTIDLMMTEFPESIEFSLTTGKPARLLMGLASNIITIQPIN